MQQVGDTRENVEKELMVGGELRGKSGGRIAGQVGCRVRGVQGKSTGDGTWGKGCIGW